MLANFPYWNPNFEMTPGERTRWGREKKLPENTRNYIEITSKLKLSIELLRNLKNHQWENRKKWVLEPYKQNGQVIFPCRKNFDIFVRSNNVREHPLHGDPRQKFIRINLLPDNLILLRLRHIQYSMENVRHISVWELQTAVSYLSHTKLYYIILL